MSTTVNQNAAATDPRAIMAQAKAEVAAHLPEFARELVIWRNTSVLPDGRLRRIAQAISAFAPEDSLRMAEDLVKNAAVDLAASRLGGASAPCLGAETTAPSDSLSRTSDAEPSSPAPTPANFRFAAHMLLSEAGRLRQLSERRRQASGEGSTLAAEYAADADSLRLVAAQLVREVGGT